MHMSRSAWPTVSIAMANKNTVFVTLMDLLNDLKYNDADNFDGAYNIIQLAHCLDLEL